MSTKHTHQLFVPAWLPSTGWATCVIDYYAGMEIMMERWRRLLALVFAAIIALMVGVFAAAVQPIETVVNGVMLGMVVTVGMTLVALIFGVEVNSVTISKEGAELDFGEQNPDDGADE